MYVVPTKHLLVQKMQFVIVIVNLSMNFINKHLVRQINLRFIGI